MSVASILLYQLLFFALFYVTGKFAFRFFSSATPEDAKFRYADLFKHTVTGLLCWITLYSVVVTKGITVNSILILLAAPFLVKRFKGGSKLNLRISFGKKESRGLIMLAFALLLLTGIQFLRYDFFNTHLLNYSLDDYFYYSFIAEKMRILGIEGKDFHMTSLFDPAHYRYPYHYFDLWMNAFYQAIAGQNKIGTFLYIFVPFVCLLSFLSILSIYELFRPRLKAYEIGLCFLMAFYFGILPFKNGAFYANALLQPRSFPSYLFCSLAFIYLYEKKYEQAIMMLCVIPVMSILGAPGILSAIFLMGLYFLFTKRSRIAWQAFGYSLFVLIALLLFYKVFGNLLGNAVTGKPAWKEYFKAFLLQLFRENLLRVWFFYIPFLLLIAANFKEARAEVKSRPVPYLFFALIFLVTVVFCAASNFNLDAGTILLFPCGAIITILATVMIALSIDKIREKSFFAVKCLALFVFLVQVVYSFAAGFRNEYSFAYYKIDKKFITDAESKIRNGDRGAYLYSAGTMDMNTWTYNPHVCHVLHFVGLINRNFDYVSLSSPLDMKGIETKTIIPISVIRDGDFNIYASKAKTDTAAVALLQSSFIRESKIGFLVVDTNTPIPREIADLVRSEVDNSTGGYKILFF